LGVWGGRGSGIFRGKAVRERQAFGTMQKNRSEKDELRNAPDQKQWEKNDRSGDSEKRQGKKPGRTQKIGLRTAPKKKKRGF